MASLTGQRFHLAAMLALLVTTLCACGDDKVIAVGGGDLDAAGDTTTLLPDGADTTEPNREGKELIVLHDSSQPLQVRVTLNQVVRVKVVDYAQGGPAKDALVQFALRPTRPEATGDGSLSAFSAYSDAAGVAAITFRSNTVADISYTIDVTTDGADPVSFELFVADAPRGTLSVALKYEGPISVKNVHLRLISGQFTCSQFNPINPPIDVLAEKTLLGVSGETSWTNLPEAQRFTVLATAESPDEHLAAAGCLDGVVIVPNQDNKVTLTLFLLTLSPTGSYHSTSVFDFTGAIPGQVGDIIDEISLLFTSPGQFLIDQIKKLAALYVGEFISNAVFGLFEDKVADIIDDWMFNESPAWVQDILTIGQDLFQIVNNLEMLATLRISKLQNDYYVQGILLWDGIALYWRLGCPEEGAPDYDPACGRNEFTLAQFANTEFPMDIIEGRFTASIQNFDQLDIDNHTIKINYGKLIIFALNELILPAISGTHNLEDAILSFVDCRSIAEGIYFSALSGIGVDVDDIEGFCTSAIGVIVSPVMFILGGLAIDSQMRMSGHAVLVDDNDDLRVDRIKDGSFLGHFESDGQEGSPFTGTWSAVKQQGP